MRAGHLFLPPFSDKNQGISLSQPSSLDHDSGYFAGKCVPLQKHMYLKIITKKASPPPKASRRMNEGRDAVMKIRARNGMDQD